MEGPILVAIGISLSQDMHVMPMAARSTWLTVVTLDMLGIGESTVEISGKELKTQMMAQAIAVVIEQMKQKVARFRLQLMSPFPCCWDSPRRMSQPILLKMHCIFPKHPHVPRLFSRLPLIAAISPPHAPTCGR
jgi:hypothetical protein